MSVPDAVWGLLKARGRGQLSQRDEELSVFNAETTARLGMQNAYMLRLGVNVYSAGEVAGGAVTNSQAPRRVMSAEISKSGRGEQRMGDCGERERPEDGVWEGMRVDPHRAVYKRRAGVSTTRRRTGRWAGLRGERRVWEMEEESQGWGCERQREWRAV